MRGSNRRNMSEAQRRAYRKRKRLIRRIQVYSEMALILVIIILVAGLIISKVVKKDKGITVAAEESVEATTEDTSTGLKVSQMAGVDPDLTVEEESTEEGSDAQTLSTGNYSVATTDSTVSIGGDVVSEYGILINNDTKEIVATKNATERIVPASMTKVMTVLTASKHLSTEQLSEVVSLSHEAVDYSYAGGGSTSGFVEDEQVTVKDLFYGTILPSGGDAAAQLAIYVAGDIDSFVDMMNEEAAELGISDTTHFTNPVGFHSDDHYSTPYDIAIIMMAALDDELCNEVLNTKVYQSTATNVNPEGITISNWFLRRIEDKDIGGTIGGAKTGYVDESGSCAVSSMTSESGTEYICCTAKSTSSWQCIYDHVAIYKTYTN